MNISWKFKIVFWAAIISSCAWLVLAVAAGVAAVRLFFAEGSNLDTRGFLEILIVSALTLQPFIVLLLIIRAIRLRGDGQSLRVVARALYPLAPIVLIVGYSHALQYLQLQSMVRTVQRWRIGTVRYACSENSPDTVGQPVLGLTERRHPGGLGTWFVEWPQRKPIEAISFPARTGSYGGSQGIKWREPDGRKMTAYVSFSDVMGKHGPTSIWVTVHQGEAIAKSPTLDTISPTTFMCAPVRYYD
jgi:hypothetical protein